jgi:hypothetical protein
MSVISSLVSVLFILCSVALGSSAFALEQPWHDKKFITDSFVKIALRREYSTNAKHEMSLKKLEVMAIMEDENHYEVQRFMYDQSVS